MFKYKDKQQLLTIYIECDGIFHRGMVISKYFEIHCHFVSVSKLGAIQVGYLEPQVNSGTLSFHFQDTNKHHSRLQ